MIPDSVIYFEDTRRSLITGVFNLIYKVSQYLKSWR